MIRPRNRWGAGAQAGHGEQDGGVRAWSTAGRVIAEAGGDLVEQLVEARVVEPPQRDRPDHTHPPARVAGERVSKPGSAAVVAEELETVCPDDADGFVELP